MADERTSQHEHIDVGHWPWKQVGRCAYCGCGMRLGQLTRLPKDMGEALKLLQSLDAITAAARRLMATDA